MIKTEIIKVFDMAYAIYEIVVWKNNVLFFPWKSFNEPGFKVKCWYPLKKSNK